MTEIDPNLWASLARAYTGGINAPVTGQVGYLAVVNADSNNLEYVSPQGLLRTVYDDTITTAAVNVTHDAGVGWVTLKTWSLSVDLHPTDDRIRCLTWELSVLDATSGVVSPVVLRGAVRRIDAGTDEVYSLDDGTKGASVTWTVSLFGTAGTLACKLAISGDSVTFEVQAHATSDRTVRGEIYYGVIRQ